MVASEGPASARITPGVGFFSKSSCALTSVQNSHELLARASLPPLEQPRVYRTCVYNSRTGTSWLQEL